MCIPAPTGCGSLAGCNELVRMATVERRGAHQAAIGGHSEAIQVVRHGAGDGKTHR